MAGSTPCSVGPSREDGEACRPVFGVLRWDRKDRPRFQEAAGATGGKRLCCLQRLQLLRSAQGNGRTGQRSFAGV